VSDNSSLSHLAAMTRPCWLRRAVRNRQRHAIEQASRRWRGTRRKFDSHTGEKRKAVEKSLQGDVAEAKALETSYADASKALEEASSRATEAEKRAAELTEGRKHRVVALRKAEAARKKEQAVIQEKEEFIREQSEAVHKS
jgi:hypothetical protein